MAISLAEGKNNASTDLDLSVIDEFRKTGVIPDSLIFDDVVNPAGGGDTLAYGYRRLITQATADTRAINSEYTDQNVTTTPYVTSLAVMGGSFGVDRVVAKLGAAASGSITLNIAQKVKSTNAKFADLVINGDTATDANGFDGLDKALVGSSTEFRSALVTNWTDFDTNARAEHKALDDIDEFLALLDGAPSVIIGNAKVLARVRAAARRAGQYTKNPIEGLLNANGRPVVRESYGDIIFADAGDKAGTSSPIIPIRAATVATVAQTGLTDLYAYRVGLDGFHGISTIGGSIASVWLPDFTTAGAVKRGEVELGPIGVALKATKAAAVWRNIKVQ
ncbi:MULTISPECIES: major capsid protein [Cryobacterium]|uniref:Phage capsid protein n=1 Tax=Cryobacterium breve TaxID=1259258 RepID=A0ABY2J4K7_9MICO|nr:MULTISPECIES: phage capsid protein [Cryobacterium]TFC92047.1 phage capsid protein [Cryobacterium sp. TmT3-12]TFC99814.1 phage capsid protein [Cryobacterium breve]